MSISASLVRKVTRASVWARNITSVVFAFALVAVVASCFFVAMGGVAGQSVALGPYVFTAAALEPWSARIYVIVMFLVGGALALALAALLLIRAVFADQGVSAAGCCRS